MTEPQPCRRAAWDGRCGAFALHQAVDLLPEQKGAATRLRLVLETRGEGPLDPVLPLLRGRFRRTRTRGSAAVDSSVGQANP